MITFTSYKSAGNDIEYSHKCTKNVDLCRTHFITNDDVLTQAMLIDERFYRNHPDWRVEEADHGVVYPGVFFRHGYQATNEVISKANLQFCNDNLIYSL